MSTRELAVAAALLASVAGAVSAQGTQRLVVTPSTLVRPPWTLGVDGYTEECRALLGGISPG